MNKKIIASAILILIVFSLSVVYAILTPQGVINKASAYKGYKTYKNKELGFSFKYPKNWYFNKYEKQGFYYYILSNRENRTSTSSLSENEVIEMEIYETRLPDHGQQTKGNIIRKISEGLDSIKYFKEINIKGGTVYLVRGSSTMVIGEADFGYLYLIDKKDENDGRCNYLIEFFPAKLSKKHEKEYLQMLRSVEVFN